MSAAIQLHEDHFPRAFLKEKLERDFIFLTATDGVETAALVYTEAAEMMAGVVRSMLPVIVGHHTSRLERRMRMIQPRIAT